MRICWSSGPPVWTNRVRPRHAAIAVIAVSVMAARGMVLGFEWWISLLVPLAITTFIWAIGFCAFVRQRGRASGKTLGHSGNETNED